MAAICALSVIAGNVFLLYCFSKVLLKCADIAYREIIKISA